MMRRLATLLATTMILAACAEKEPPPRPVSDFVDNPILLEAAIVRCSRNRAELRYDQECMNAREAVQIVEAKEEEVRRAELEARSEAKRRALRRRQEAVAEAHRLAEEERRRREEAEYLAQFGVLPPADDAMDEDELPDGNVPLAIVPEADTLDAQPSTGQSLPEGDGGNAPAAETAPVDDETP